MVRRLAAPVLLLVCTTAYGAAGRHRGKGVPASLLLSYEVTNDQDTMHEVWFVDGQGRTFAFSRTGGADPLAQALRTESVGGRDAAALITASRPLPAALSPAELQRAQALLAAAERSILWTHRRKDPCKLGVNVTVRGYLFSNQNRPATVVPLRETSCGWRVDENLSPEAQELIEWVYRLSGKPRPRLRR
ncbi:MAG TPA: hypothetical protein VHH90_07935 [Polyangia bacterium]|nr:hypothetical protein [Polyangia bacterium]